ncbi:MAG TPA: hypothetical protein VGH20_10910 [Myxococcales bacterium]|jgi:hypothetical protein
MPAALCALGAVLLSFGIAWLAVPAAICAFAAAVVSSRTASTPDAALPDGHRDLAAGRRSLPGLGLLDHPAAAQVVFGIGFLRGLYWLLFEQSLVSPQRLDGFRGLSLFAFICASAYLCVHLRASLEKARFWVLIVLFVALALALDARFVSLVAVVVADVTLGRSGAAHYPFAPRAPTRGGARSVAAFTPDLAALFLLYQPLTWNELTRASGAAMVVAAIALAAVLAMLVSADWTARGAAVAAVVCAVLGWWSGRSEEVFWISTALLSCAAAGFARARQSARLAMPAR